MTKKILTSQCNCKSNNATGEFVGGESYMGPLLLLIVAAYLSQLGGFSAA